MPDEGPSRILKPVAARMAWSRIGSPLSGRRISG